MVHEAELTLAKSITALRTAWVETQAPLINTAFLEWFYDSNVVRRLLAMQLRHPSSWGPDFIWCEAARQFGADHNSTREPCAIITVPVHHVNTGSINSKLRSYIRRSFALLGASGIAVYKFHHCAPNAPTALLGWGCPEREKAHPWFDVFGQAVCADKRKPQGASAMRLIRRCASVGLECEAEARAGSGHAERARARAASCNGMRGLYKNTTWPQYVHANVSRLYRDV